MKEKFAPTIVLGAICLIAALLLAATYQVTAPQIEKIAIENANAARYEVMPEADGFEKVDCEMIEGVTEVFKATNDAGIVITSAAKGFGGDIVVMTAIDPNGNIEKVKVTDCSTETAGLGSKTADAAYTDQYTGAATITSGDGEGTVINPISGATYSSKGVFNAVSAALEQYAQIGGAQ